MSDALDDVLLREGRHADPALAVVSRSALQRLRDAIRYDSRIVGRGILEPLVDAIEVGPCPDPEPHDHERKSEKVVSVTKESVLRGCLRAGVHLVRFRDCDDEDGSWYRRGTEEEDLAKALMRDETPER